MIGQLGENSTIEETSLDLKLILDHIFSVLKDVQNLIGGRLILLECEDSSSLISYYIKHGFEVLQKEEFVQMVKLFDII